MPNESCELGVKVLASWKIERFEGQAILAGVRPRFVIALLIKDSSEPYHVKDSDVSFLAHRVVFFAVDSIIKIFMESGVEGKEYTMTIETEMIDKRKTYFLRRSPPRVD